MRKPAKKPRTVTRGISLPKRIEKMALESAARYGQNFSAYIRGLIVRDNLLKP